jgi:hypothetical protein
MSALTMTVILAGRRHHPHGERVMSWQLTLSLLGILGTASFIGAEDPPRKASRTTYLIQAKVIRAYVSTDGGNRGNLERSSSTLPDILTLEGSRGDYLTEKKIQAGLYQTRLQALVQRVSEAKVMIDIVVEEVWPEGPADAPTIHRKMMQVTRRIGLGEKLRFALSEKNERDEGVWVELTVKEAEE